MIKIINQLSEANEKLRNASKDVGFFIPKDIIKVLSKSNNSYLVGGCIRDILTDKIPKDLDFVTDIPYDELTVLFKNEGFTVKETGKQFLVMVVSKDGNDYEVANFRIDNYSDNKIIGVSIGDIYSDANRRDFYINSLTYSLSTKSIKDPTGQGLNDISTNTLRFIGKAEDRLKEDPLRVMRFYRFIAKGFIPDPKSLTAVRRLFDVCIKSTNSERIKNEIEKMVL
jgi:tRNA nucleotidyltransferase (CCA-adding enzyme)